MGKGGFLIAVGIFLSTPPQLFISQPLLPSLFPPYLICFSFFIVVLRRERKHHRERKKIKTVISSHLSRTGRVKAVFNVNPNCVGTKGHKTIIFQIRDYYIPARSVSMPGLLETCDELFETKDLYVVLGIDKTANSGQIKKAYHKVNFSSNIYSEYTTK